MVEVNYEGDDVSWAHCGEAVNLSLALLFIDAARGYGQDERCMAGYRVLDRKKRVVLLLAPICMRIEGGRFYSHGENPERSTV